MIELDNLRFTVHGSYPKSPLKRQKRRICRTGCSDYGQVDMAMREPVRTLNEELGIRTFTCCECHPYDIDPRCYDTSRYRYDDFCRYRQPYRSYIGMKLGSYDEVAQLVDFLGLVGFTATTGLPPGERKVTTGMPLFPKVRVSHDLCATFPAGLLSFSYRYYGTGADTCGKCRIEVEALPEKPLRAWNEWDRVRDTGWEYWLEVLYLFKWSEHYI